MRALSRAHFALNYLRGRDVRQGQGARCLGVARLAQRGARNGAQQRRRPCGQQRRTALVHAQKRSWTSLILVLRRFMSDRTSFTGSSGVTSESISTAPVGPTLLSIPSVEAIRAKPTFRRTRQAAGRADTDAPKSIACPCAPPRGAGGEKAVAVGHGTAARATPRPTTLRSRTGRCDILCVSNCFHGYDGARSVEASLSPGGGGGTPLEVRLSQTCASLRFKC